jgi:hypothetical protein
MRFIIGGRTFNLNSLDPVLDQAFIDLYASYIGATPFSWSVLDQATQTFLLNSPDRDNIHNLYFNNFITLWNSFLRNGNYNEAENIWQMALEPILAFEAAIPPREAHKGTAFYFWGMTSIIRGDLDKGYALVHQAVEEDIATMKVPYPDTPAYALASLNYAKQDQAFRQWVVMQAQFLNGFQNNYSTQYGRQFILEDFRSRFLNSPPSIDIVFLFAYTVARLMRLSASPSYSLQSRFSGQLLINLLFDLTLAIEAAAKAKNPGGKSFIHHAKFISQKANDVLTIAKLREINRSFHNDFDLSIRSTIDGVFTLADGTNLSRLQSDIAVSCGIRNRGAHDVSSSPTVWQRFSELNQILLNVLFMTVDFAY